MAAVLTEEEKARLRKSLPAGVTLHLAIPADLPPVAMDGQPLRTVFRHLLANAQEAITGAGPSAWRRPQGVRRPTPGLLGDPRPGPHVLVIVTDTGGVSFSRSKSAARGAFFYNEAGTPGIGIPTVFRTLHAHGAGLRFGPGRGGTAVEVVLPLTPRGSQA